MGRNGHSLGALTLTASLALALSSCTPADPGAESPVGGARTSAATSPTTATPVQDRSASTASASPTSTRTPGKTQGTRPSPTPTAAAFDPDLALATVRHLAGEIGPREASGPGSRAAVAFIEQELTSLGFTVGRQRVPVPAGTSWGVPVPKGSTNNVIAEPPGFDARRTYVLVGAHLDTVPQAPGAEDNASGVAVLLELARMISEDETSPQVRLVAFGAEEPRGPGDDLHHFGSRVHVDELSRAERDMITAMVSLDRVGVRGRAVPVCHGGLGTTSVRRSLVRAAGAIPTTTCENRASDHWSFEKAEIPAARVGSIPYDGYHSERDIPSVVDRRQLDRVGRLLWFWLQSR